MIQANIKYWTAVALPASGTVLGPAIAIPYNGRLSFLVTWTGTPIGTFSLQVRYPGGTWSGTVPGSGTEWTTSPNAQPAGGAQATPMVVNYSVAPGGEYRLVYTASSGTGTATVTAHQGDVIVED